MYNLYNKGAITQKKQKNWKAKKRPFWVLECHIRKDAQMIPVVDDVLRTDSSDCSRSKNGHVRTLKKEMNRWITSTQFPA